MWLTNTEYAWFHAASTLLIAVLGVLSPTPTALTAAAAVFAAGCCLHYAALAEEDPESTEQQET